MPAADCGRGYAAVDGEQLIGVILWWQYGESLASVGTLIVADKYQRRGIGRRLMQAVLDDSAGMRMLLNATVESAPLYRSMGFVETGTVHQHQGVIYPGVAKPFALPPDVQIYDLQSEDEDGMLALDRRVTGGDRSTLFEVLRAEAGAVARVAVRSGTVVACALSRPFGYGRIVGPVAADNEELATGIIAAILQEVPPGFVRVDVPCPTAAAAADVAASTYIVPAVLSKYLTECQLPCAFNDVRAMERPTSGSNDAAAADAERQRRASSNARIYGLASQALC